MSILWRHKHFNELSLDELFTLMRARVDVFVVEQNCPYPELDDADIAADTLHLMGYQDGQLCAYARCISKGENLAIGRVLCVDRWRGQGVAKELMNEALSLCHSHFPGRTVVLSAQTYLLDFYRGFGFETQGERYLEDGIEHQDMQLIGQ
ncbi:GNAT family N-acetyltransferase [Pseudoalteromonas sp. T1lg75]|uniref:GNAT family N-acetyltransferase n=1 Tax=Pseudoalteromonas sp. T1lg75 TaxID=2077102 RepID=UPI000CF62E29|nr:GNAT family N-acetyltransferase [Pseudoalteromonas sp. T1lg75]